VGFCTYNYPWPDMPETFEERINNYNCSYDPEIMYQIDYSPIWAKNRKMPAFKFMKSMDNKENLRTTMEYYKKTEDDPKYVCAAKFYSLTNKGKAKIIMHQVDFLDTRTST
jgi:hypothetical protein